MCRDRLKLNRRDKLLKKDCKSRCNTDKKDSFLQTSTRTNYRKYSNFYKE